MDPKPSVHAPNSTLCDMTIAGVVLWKRQNVWNNDGDTAHLINPNQILVDQTSRWTTNSPHLAINQRNLTSSAV